MTNNCLLCDGRNELNEQQRRPSSDQERVDCRNCGRYELSANAAQQLRNGNYRENRGDLRNYVARQQESQDFPRITEYDLEAVARGRQPDRRDQPQNDQRQRPDNRDQRPQDRRQDPRDNRDNQQQRSQDRRDQRPENRNSPDNQNDQRQQGKDRTQKR